jgi:hypothetical protein
MKIMSPTFILLRICCLVAVLGRPDGKKMKGNHVGEHMGMGQKPIPVVNIKIAGKWMFIP